MTIIRPLPVIIHSTAGGAYGATASVSPQPRTICYANDGDDTFVNAANSESASAAGAPQSIVARAVSSSTMSDEAREWLADVKTKMRAKEELRAKGLTIEQYVPQVIGAWSEAVKQLKGALPELPQDALRELVLEIYETSDGELNMAREALVNITSYLTPDSCREISVLLEDRIARGEKPDARIVYWIRSALPRLDPGDRLDRICFLEELMKRKGEIDGKILLVALNTIAGAVELIPLEERLKRVNVVESALSLVFESASDMWQFEAAQSIFGSLATTVPYLKAVDRLGSALAIKLFMEKGEVQSDEYLKAEARKAMESVVSHLFQGDSRPLITAIKEWLLNVEGGAEQLAQIMQDVHRSGLLNRKERRIFERYLDAYQKRNKEVRIAEK